MLKAKGVEAGEERECSRVESFIDLRRSLWLHAPGGGEHALDTGGRGGCGEVLLGHLSELGEAVLDVVLPPALVRVRVRVRVRVQGQGQG